MPGDLVTVDIAAIAGSSRRLVTFDSAAAAGSSELLVSI